MAAEKRGIGAEAALYMHEAELYARDRICAVAAGRALERCMSVPVVFSRRLYS
jgi:hypothetical protein